MNRIAALRKLQKLSQKDFGSIIGVAQNTISNWENGNREPDFDTALRIADYFNVTVDYLLGRDEEKPPTVISEEQNSMDEALMKYVRSMTPDQKQMLLAQMRVLSEQNK